MFRKLKVGKSGITKSQNDYATNKQNNQILQGLVELNLSSQPAKNGTVALGALPWGIVVQNLSSARPRFWSTLWGFLKPGFHSVLGLSWFHSEFR